MPRSAGNPVDEVGRRCNRNEHPRLVLDDLGEAPGCLQLEQPRVRPVEQFEALLTRGKAALEPVCAHGRGIARGHDMLGGIGAGHGNGRGDAQGVGELQDEGGGNDAVEKKTGRHLN